VVIAARILNRLADRLASALAPPSGRLLPWIVGDAVVGHLDARRAAIAAGYDDVFHVDDCVRLSPRLADARARTAALARVARDLARRGELTRWRNERYAVGPHDAPLLVIERAAARFFGIPTTAAHANGTTLRDGVRCMWIARRSATKAIDPGQLDNLVGGGVAAGVSVFDTLVREAREEAGIPEALARAARPAGNVAIRRMQPDGLHHDTIHVYDVDLPASFVPVNDDGEVAGFRLATPAIVAEIAGNTDGPDVMTADASLVVADWLIRVGEAPVDAPAGAKLAALRHA
jgi:8-oxo-dGTP pyrophosphatase MutT (NUDIX family)